MNKKSWYMGVLCIMISIGFTAFAEKSTSGTVYAALRNKWSNRLTGNGAVIVDDADYKDALEITTTTAQKLWDSMIKPASVSTDGSTLWEKLNVLRESKDISTVYRNLRSMSTAYATKNSSLYNNTALKTDIIAGLDWMYQNCYNEKIEKVYKNWWDWDIGAPQALGDIAVLLYDDLSEQQRVNYVKALNHFNPKPLEVPGGPNPLTGANLLDTALVCALKGLVAENANNMKEAATSISAVLPYVTSSDGFYTDGSFIQHYDIPYAGGYGGILLSCIDKLIFIFDKTEWEVTDPLIVNVYDWILNSYEPLYYRGALMDMTSGRGISRYKDSDHNRGKLPLQPMLLLSYSAPVDKKARIQAFIKENVLMDTVCQNYFRQMSIPNMIAMKNLLADKTVPMRGDLILHKNYAAMDRVVHHRPGFSLGISMYSTRIGSFEIGNGENKKGFRTADGMVYLYNNDTAQFADAFWATVDMMRLSGITTDGTEGYIARNWKGFHSSKDWVGGSVLNDLYGAVGMDLENETNSLKAKKSWFCFDDEIVCLGAGISASDGRNVETIVENRKITEKGTNKFLVNGKKINTTLDSSATEKNATWAFLAGNTKKGNDSIGYYFPEGAQVAALREARTGNWKDINDRGRDEEVTRNYASLAIQHGENPQNASYAYVILPNQKEGAVKKYARKPQITILANTPEMQAVKETKLGIIGANFWTAGSIAGITVGTPASVMVKSSTATVEIAVSDPTQKNTIIELEITETVSGVAFKDDAITVKNSETGKTTISVNVTAAAGKSFRVIFNK